MTASHLDALEKLVAPPKTVPSAPIAWPDLERLLGARFPDDYKAYVETYGVGNFNGLGIGDVRHGDLVTLTNALGAARLLQREGRDIVANDRFFPDEGGLFPIGSTGNGDTLWLRLSDGAVVFTDDDDTERDEHLGGTTAFLHDVLSGKHVSPILPTTFLKKKSSFTPFQKKVVASFAFAPPYPVFADVAAALESHLGKAKARTKKSYTVEYETALFTVRALTSNDIFSMSTTYPVGNEAAARTALEGFFAKVSLVPTSITDFAKNPIWQATPPDANASASLVATVRTRVSPPASPVDARGDRSAIERILGTGLPADFHELVETYGNGVFGGAIRLFAPFTANPEHALVRQWFERLPALHLRRGSYSAASGLVPFVKSGTTMGLLPFGATKDGVLCFDTRGAPDTWKVIALDNFTDTKFEAHTFDGGLAAFLLAALDGTLPFLGGALRGTFEQ